jgi:hypothetical protein
MTGPTPCNSNINKLQQEHLLLTPGQAIRMQIDLLEPLLLVTQAERRELRLAVSRAAVRALFEQCLLPLASGVDAVLCRALGCTRSACSRGRARSSTVSSTASASRCAASSCWRRSTRASAARSATRSCRAFAPRSATCLTRGCGTTRATFSPTASCLPTGAAVGAARRRLPTRLRSGIPRVAG